MNAETSRYYIDNLYTQDNTKCYQALNFVKNSIMGSNKQKGIVIANGILPRLLQVIHYKTENEKFLSGTFTRFIILF
jgi:armadillo repeat-containing protein 8